MSVDISQTICEAIDLIINKRLSTAPFNKTIEGKINSVVNVNQRKYKVTYTGGPGTIVAYGLQGSSYKKNDMVFILMPSNGDCIILGKRETLQQANVSNRNSYTKIGETIVYRDNNTAVTASFGNLCSYGNDNLSEPHNRDQVVFVSSKTEANSSDEALKNYIKSSPNGVVLSAIVSTRLAATQIGGNYGVKFKIVFHRKTDYTKFRQQEYVLDVRDIVGVNPYLVQEAMYIEHVIPASQFDFENFAYVKQVKAFCDGFPYDGSIATLVGSNKSPYYDITVVNPSICTAFVISPEESKDYHLFLEAEKGNFLGITDSVGHTVNSLPVKAVLKHNGEQSVTGVIYHWFVKDQSIGVGNDNYYDYAGPGWRYINKKKSDGKNRYSVRTFNFTTEIPNPLTQNWDKNNYLIRNNLTTVKCIAELGGDRWENETQIHFDNGIKIWITNSVVSNLENNNYIFNNKARFAFKCNYQDDQQVTNGNSQKGFDTDRYNYKLSWKLIANQRDQRTIIKTNNNEYFYLGDQYNNTGSGNERLFIEDIAHGILSCSIERQLKEPTGSPYIFLGGTEVNFYYKPGTGEYHINIQNGNRLMQFDENGKFSAPDTGLVLEPLKFTLIDPNGNEVKKISTEEEPSRIMAWLWEVPKTKTLIKVEETAQTNSGEINIPEDIFANHNYYKGIVQAEGVEEDSIGSLTWIPNTYNVNAVNNTIKLYVLFKQNAEDRVPTQIEASTVFTPIKMGDPGTNGTNTYAYLTPYKENGAEDQQINTTRIYAYHSTEENAGVLQGFYSDNDLSVIEPRKFKFRYDIIHDNVPASINNETKIKWELPINQKIGVSYSFTSFLEPSPTTGRTSYIVQSALLPMALNNIPQYTANIVRAAFTNANDLNFYAEYPICYVHTEHSEYKIKIEQGTGYTYVVYDEAGRSPRYNGTNTFTVQVYNNGILQEEGLNYQWSVFPNPLNPSSTTGFTLVNPTSKTVTCKPFISSECNDLTRAISCVITNTNNNIIGFIHIPISVSLNKYGHKYLNDWDGHSIQLNANDGGTILAPEMGAGVKNTDDNTFTGVLMGKVQTKNNNTTKTEIGLFGYDKGVRSFFLDSETGKTVLGKNGDGQIIADPHLQVRKGTGSEYKNAALLYSGNYTLPTVSNNKMTLNVETYRSNTGGMIIDLSTPQIGFGNGNFYVNNDGLLHATGATISGNITIDTSSAGYNTLKNNLNEDLDIPDVQGLAVKTVDYSPSGEGENENNQIIRGYAGIGSKKMPNCDVNYDFGSSYTSVITPGTNPSTSDRTADKDAGNVRYFRLWAGTGTGTAQQSFGVDHQGILYAKGAYIQGNIQANSKIGNNNTVSSNGNISATRVGMGRTKNPVDVTNFPGMTGTKYLNLWGKSNSSELGKSNLVFGITENGEVLARSAHITGHINATSGSFTGTITATSGQIANWTIASSKLTYGSVGMGSNVAKRADLNAAFGTTYKTTDSDITLRYWAGSNVDNKELGFAVSNAGTLYATGAYIKGKITATSGSFSGSITSTTGSIGGWQLGDTKLAAYSNGTAKDSKYTVLSSKQDGSYAINIGTYKSAGTQDLAFTVDHAGKLVANNVDIKGKVTATEGSFTGTITATSGTIGEWSIGTDSHKNLKNGTTGLGTQTVSQSIMNTNFGRNAQRTAKIWSSKDGTNTNINFMVDAEGVLYAKGAYIRNASIDVASIPTIDASKINADNLKVKAANITGTLTASQIDAGSLSVKAANVTGTFSADKISASTVGGATISNSIYWRRMTMVTGMYWTSAAHTTLRYSWVGRDFLTGSYTNSGTETVDVG